MYLIVNVQLTYQLIIQFIEWLNNAFNYELNIAEKETLYTG